MSPTKFAPITANLLARKGEAAPSLVLKRSFAWAQDVSRPRDYFVPSALPPVVIEPPRAPEPVQNETVQPVPKADPAKPRRIVVNLTPGEFERLGIAAAKKGATRHEIVQATMHGFLERLAHELNDECACLLNGSGCPGDRVEGKHCGAEP